MLSIVPHQDLLCPVIPYLCLVQNLNRVNMTISTYAALNHYKITIRKVVLEMLKINLEPISVPLSKSQNLLTLLILIFLIISNGV